MNGLTINFDYSGIIAFQGYLLDEKKLLQSSSGGAARAIIDEFIRKNGVVFGVENAEDVYSARYCCVEDASQISRIIGSKYIYADKMIQLQSQVISVYQLAGKYLLENREVLFVGLGCDVAALKKYCKIHEIPMDNLYLIDLICQGPTLPGVQEMYIRNLEKKYKSKAIDFSVRYKKYGWIPPHIKVVFENGKVYDESLYGSDFGFALRNCSRECCYNCRFKGANHESDLTLGDYWGLHKNDSGYNRNGVSILLAKTDKGIRLVEQIDPMEFAVEKADIEKALLNNPMYYMSREKYHNQEYFENTMKEIGLHDAVINEVGKVNYYKMRFLRMVHRVIKRKR